MLKSKISSEEINSLPLKAWEGNTVVISNPNAVPKAVREISSYRVIAFDTESKPAFRKGEYNPVALLQIAVPGKVFLIRVSKTGFGQELASIFASPDIKKVGVAINDDIKELRKFFEFQPEEVIELARMADNKGIENGGVRGLTGLLLGFRISKRQQTSNWENPQLTKPQVQYAATDAWVCLEIYKKLSQMSDQ